MRFVADHVIRGLGPGAYEALYFDEPFNEALCAALSMQRRLTQRDADARGIVRRVAIVPARLVPAPLKRLLGDRNIAYTELAEYTWGTLVGRWVLEPGLFADRIAGEGSFTFHPHPLGTRRVIEGDLRLAFFGLGPLAERAVVAETRRSYDLAADFTNRYVAEHPAWQKKEARG